MSRLYAIDLGAWSVKVVVAQPGLRGATVTHVIERLVPQTEAGQDERTFAVLAGIVKELGLEHDTAYLGVYGDQVFTHVLEFGFKHLKRAELNKAVGAELEGVVPVDLEDMVYSFEPLPPPPAPAPIEPGSVVRGRIAAPPSGMRVLTYSLRTDRARELIGLAAAAGAEPRALLAAGGPAARLVERLPSLAAARTAGPVAVVDIGHERTDVIVVRSGKAVFSRAIARGGRQVTERIATEWKMPLAEAEAAKHADGFVASTAMPPTSDAWARISTAIMPEIAPLARELRQTFAACRARTGDTVGAVVLVGGGSRLRGLAPFVAEHLGVQTFVVGPDDAIALAGRPISADAPIDAAAMTVALAHEAATGRPLFDLRTGELAFKVDLSFLRTKAVPLAAAALAIIACAGMAAYFHLYKLRNHEHVLADRLARETRELFDGKSMTAEEVLSSTAAAPREVSPMPKESAYDLLLDINSKLPAKDKVTVEVTNIDITEGSVKLSGSAKTDPEIDSIITALKDIKCFQDIKAGARETGPKGERKFQLTITSACM